ncbi:MAG: histidine kinase [Bacteroidetes bacterium]|nr:histidine kinase [Bacteroidota bacterium]
MAGNSAVISTFKIIRPNFMTRLSHRRMLLLLIVTPLLLFLELAIGFAVFSSIRNIDLAENKSTKLDVYLRTNGRYVSKAESAQRGYLLTGESRYRDTFAVCRAGIQKNEEYYDSLENESKSETIAKMRVLSARKFEEMGQTIHLHDAGLKDSALFMVKSGVGKLMMDSILTASHNLRAQITVQIAHERKKERRLFISFFVLIAVLIVFNIFLVQYTYRKFTGYTRELEMMVHSLEAANERMSEYTAISYHELKTPLRNIHGFAQLLKVRYSHAGEEESEEDEFIQYITDGVIQMNKTINNMRLKYLDTSADNKTKLKQA